MYVIDTLSVGDRLFFYLSARPFINNAEEASGIKLGRRAERWINEAQGTLTYAVVYC